MKSFKTLNITGALLDNNQFFKYIENISAEHTIKKQSDKITFPIPNLKENFNFIYETYNLLNKHIKMGIKIHSAGEWILDNFYIIEEAFKTIQKEIKISNYKNLPAIATGKYKGFARIYVLAAEIVAFTECSVNDENLKLALTAYQNKKALSIEEINQISLFLKIILIDKIKDVWEKIHKEAFSNLKKGEGFENTEKIFEELKECILESGKELSKEEITEEIEKWLFGKKKSEASLFIRRYWFGERKAVLSAAAFLSSEKLEQKLLKLRKSLCRCFEEKKIAVSSPEQIFFALSGIDEKLVRNAQKQKWKKPIYKLWQFWAAVGFMILSIFAAVYINIQSEKNSEYNYYFRDCVLNWSDSNYSFKELEDSIEYDVSRNFGYMRKSIEKEGIIPVFKDYQNFIGTGYYSAGGELRRLSLTWEHLAYMGFGYRKIRISLISIFKMLKYQIY